MKLLQTDPLLNDKINKYGCYFMSLLSIVEDKYNREFMPLEVDTLYDVATINGAMDVDCYIMAPDAVLKYASKMAGKIEKILQVGIKDDKGQRFWGWVKGETIDYIIGKYRTANGNTHFVLLDKDVGKIKYDPNPKTKLVDLLALVYYRVYP